jgi:hypothetical protein
MHRSAAYALDMRLCTVASRPAAPAIPAVLAEDGSKSLLPSQLRGKLPGVDACTGDWADGVGEVGSGRGVVAVEGVDAEAGAGGDAERPTAMGLSDWTRLPKTLAGVVAPCMEKLRPRPLRLPGSRRRARRGRRRARALDRQRARARGAAVGAPHRGRSGPRWSKARAAGTPAAIDSAAELRLAPVPGPGRAPPSARLYRAQGFPGRLRQLMRGSRGSGGRSARR